MGHSQRFLSDSLLSDGSDMVILWLHHWTKRQSNTPFCKHFPQRRYSAASMAEISDIVSGLCYRTQMLQILTETFFRIHWFLWLRSHELGHMETKPTNLFYIPSTWKREFFHVRGIAFLQFWLALLRNAVRNSSKTLEVQGTLIDTKATSSIADKWSPTKGANMPHQSIVISACYWYIPNSRIWYSCIKPCQTSDSHHWSTNRLITFMRRTKLSKLSRSARQLEKICCPCSSHYASIYASLASNADEKI